MQLAPNTRQVPAIPVVAVEAAEMQYDAVEMSEISRSDSGFNVHHLFLKLLATDISENVNCQMPGTEKPSAKNGCSLNQAAGWRRLTARSGHT